MEIQTTVMVAAGSLVAIAVIMLAVCVKFMGAVNQLLERQGEPGQVMMQGAVPIGAPAIYTAPAAPQDPALNGVDEETAAMIMAITADAMGAAPEDLRFISIKEC